MMSDRAGDTAVFFDLDGTLVEFTEPYADILERTLAPYLVDPAQAAEECAERFRAAFAAHDPEPYHRALQAVCAARSTDADPTLLAEELLRAELEATRVAPGARDLLATLENYPLGVCSNGTRRVQEAKLRWHSLEQFDAVVVSYDVGAHKPDQAMFAAAREAIDARQYLMIGDDAEADVRAAREAGFRAVHIDPEVETDATVPGLDALGAVVEL